MKFEKLTVLIAYDSFIPDSLAREVLSNYLKEVTKEIEFISYEVRPEDTPKSLPNYLDELTFGSPEDLIKRIKDVDVLIVHKAPVTAEVINAAKQLKVIGCARTGPGNIDINAATKRCIPVIYALGRNAVAVAEFTVGLILAATRHISRAEAWMRAGKWRIGGGAQQQFFMGMELQGKTLGIIGFGQIGRRVASLMKCFGMNILVHDPFVEKKEIESFGVKSVDKDTLLKESDIISLHVRIPPNSKPVIGKKELSLMKKTAYLINTSDGPVVDQKALYEALKNREIAGAAQDAGWGEDPVSPTNPLLELDNFTATPAIGGASLEVPKRSIQIIAEDIARFLKGEKPKNIKNPEVLTK